MQDQQSQRDTPFPWRLIAALAALPCAAALIEAHTCPYLKQPGQDRGRHGHIDYGTRNPRTIAGLGLSWAHRKDNKRWVRNLTITAIFAVSAGVLILCRSQLG